MDWAYEKYNCKTVYYYRVNECITLHTKALRKQQSYRGDLFYSR